MTVPSDASSLMPDEHPERPGRPRTFSLGWWTRWTTYSWGAATILFLVVFYISLGKLGAALELDGTLKDGSDGFSGWITAVLTVRRVAVVLGAGAAVLAILNAAVHRTAPSIVRAVLTVTGVALVSINLFGILRGW